MVRHSHLEVTEVVGHAALYYTFHKHHQTRNTCTQQPLARLPDLFSVMLRLHTAINRADFVSW